ncbi:c-type cytochrome [Flavihumibacter profundi]|uniref:c-type cytochrome n=1 Tax=Flavihumibacter profundi TaxID=2716883 RepID=UPI001CC74B3E|nr:cytochrome c [Flavihumibacter profundi]MBZ5857104.1 cytochrome c [Flavihumibacter profundi]
MKKFLLLAGMVSLIYACGGGNKEEKKETPATAESTESAPAAPADEKGIGKFTKVDLGDKLDAGMAQAGKGIFDIKCSACHKLTEEKLVGPGWKNVTQRRKPEWIMNFVTNVDEMLSKDPKAQAQLEICLVRMPNQNLTDDDARHILEFMRMNDGVK